VQLAPAVASLLGVVLAGLLYLREPKWVVATSQRPMVRALRRFWYAGWGFDWLYERLFVRPYEALARASRNDPADLLPQGLAAMTRRLHGALSATQTGRLRHAVAALAVGAIVLLLVVMCR
jgi:NADH-quinone oxidoreductase subunit L